MVGQINHHLYRKRGFYYFCRRVPKALLAHYTKPRIVLALKTKQYRDALRQSQIISKRLDDQWFHMQLDAIGLDNVQSKLFQSVKPLAPLMSEATSFYLRLKGGGKDKVFVRSAQRNAASVIEVLGDRPINDYASSEAGKLRDVLLDKGLAVTSIKRMFGSVKAIINLAMAEHGIEGRNPFASIYMPDEMPEERQPIPLEAIRRIQSDCMAVDDENRWLLALISDTGMRLSEAAGLARDDIVVDTDEFRARINAAITASKSSGINTDHIIIIGYCFGGAATLEAARAGVDADGFVSFHGGLGTPEGQNYSQTTAPILLLHGSADPVSGMDDLASLLNQLEEAKVPHDAEVYGGARHSFTVSGSRDYDQAADAKAWDALVRFLNKLNEG